ncbi:hypothetical protein Leryth_022214, partial [Lithospermum erythrorhizon]
ESLAPNKAPISPSGSSSGTSTSTQGQASSSSNANAKVDVKQICDGCDNPALCLETVSPSVSGKSDVNFVLQISLKATIEFAKYCQNFIKTHAISQGSSQRVQQCT